MGKGSNHKTRRYFDLNNDWRCPEKCQKIVLLSWHWRTTMEDWRVYIEDLTPISGTYHMKKKVKHNIMRREPNLQLSDPQENRHNLKPWLSLFTCGAQPLGYTWTRLYYNIGIQLQSGLLFNSRRIWSLYGLGGHIHLLWHHTGNLKGFSPLVGFFTKFVPAISEIQWN